MSADSCSFCGAQSASLWSTAAEQMAPGMKHWTDFKCKHLPIGKVWKPRCHLVSKNSSLSRDVFLYLLDYLLWLWAEWNLNRSPWDSGLSLLPCAYCRGPACALGKHLLVCTCLSLPVVLVAGAAHSCSQSCLSSPASEAMPNWFGAPERRRSPPSPRLWFTTYPQVIKSENIHFLQEKPFPSYKVLCGPMASTR